MARGLPLFSVSREQGAVVSEFFAVLAERLMPDKDEKRDAVPEVSLLHLEICGVFHVLDARCKIHFYLVLCHVSEVHAYLVLVLTDNSLQKI